MLKVSKNIMFRLSTVFDCIRLVSTCLVSWNLSMKQLWDVRSSTDFHRFPQFKADMFVALKAAQYFCYLDHLPPEGVTFPCRWSSDDLFHSSDYFKFFTVSHSFSMFFIDIIDPVESSFYKDTFCGTLWMSEVAFQTDKEAAPITRAKSSPNMGRDLRCRCQSFRTNLW